MTDNQRLHANFEPIAKRYAEQIQELREALKLSKSTVGYDVQWPQLIAAVQRHKSIVDSADRFTESFQNLKHVVSKGRS